MSRYTAMCLALIMVACGGDSAAPTPKTGDFVLDAKESAEIEKTRKEGKGAEGTYSYDQEKKQLSFDFSQSTFNCDGPTKGAKVTATVTELTATQLTWEMEGDSQSWDRVDEGTEGVVGVWKSGEDDRPFFLIITADGKVQVFGGEDCGNGGKKNEENCRELSLSGASMLLDGNLSDWDAVRQSATITDKKDDHQGDDAGADIRAMKVEIEGESLYVLMQLHAAPSTRFQGRQPPNGGSYRLDLKHVGGNSVTARISYSPENERWELLEPGGQDPGVEFAIGPDGVEWKVKIALFGDGGDARFSSIRVEAIDCGQGPCQRLDEIDDCGYFPGFK